MDLVRFGRGASSTAAQVGFVTMMGAGFLIVLGLYDSRLVTFQIFVASFYFLLLGIVAFASGGIMWLAYFVEEYREVRRIKTIVGEVESSKDFELVSPALLLDSVDREILEIVKAAGGDILAVENQMKSRALAQAKEEQRLRIGNLVKVHMVRFHKRKLNLKPIGHEAINTPPAMYTSRIPTRVREHLFESKRQLWLEKWGQAVIESHKAIEASYKQVIKSSLEKDEKMAKRLDEIEKAEKPIDKMSAGRLHNLMIEFGMLRKNSFERWLSNEVTKIRPKAHDTDAGVPYSSEDAFRCELYTAILMRSIYT